MNNTDEESKYMMGVVISDKILDLLKSATETLGLTASDYIASLIEADSLSQDSKLSKVKELEKALELACKELGCCCDYCSYATAPDCPIEADCLDEKIKYFKTKAKEEVNG